MSLDIEVYRNCLGSWNYQLRIPLRGERFPQITTLCDGDIQFPTRAAAEKAARARRRELRAEHRDRLV
jgi:hypothetical protein